MRGNSQSDTSNKTSNVFKHFASRVGHAISSGIKKVSQFVDTYLINKIKQAVKFIFGASSSGANADQPSVVPTPPRLAPEVHKEVAPP